MSEQTFTIRPYDQPVKPDEERCSRCLQDGPTVATANWNETTFRYCAACVKGK
jgi:hypothetical protein